MTGRLSIWLLFFAIAAGTFAWRFSFIYLSGKFEMPFWIKRALQYVPAAVLAALVFPALVYTGGVLDISFQNFHLVAGLIAALVAWRTKNVVLTIITGMAALWILQALF